MKHFSPSAFGPAKAVAASALGKLLGRPSNEYGRKFLMDAHTYDQATMDSVGAFLIGELERLDPILHAPLAAVTWYRDIDLRTDVTIEDDSSSFILTSFGGAGGLAPGGINWVTPQTTALPRFTLDGKKIVSPLEMWGGEVAFTIPELQKSQRLNRPVDAQQLQALNLKDQMDTDQLVYIGDSTKGTTGLLNSAYVVNTGNVVNGANASPLWKNKTPAEILADVNELIVSVWAASGWKVAPNKLLLPPQQFGFIATTFITSAGTQSILSYIRENNVLTAQFNQPLDIQPCKWCIASYRGAGSDIMMAYTQDVNYVRFPKVPLQSAAQQFSGLWITTPYYNKLGVLEYVYPETGGTRAGL